MKANKDYYDVSAELDALYGKPGTPEYKEFVKEAWEEYNAQVLHDARKRAKLTQKELAKRMGVDKSYISKIERGIIVPSVATFYEFIAAIGKTVAIVNPPDIICGDGTVLRRS